MRSRKHACRDAHPASAPQRIRAGCTASMSSLGRVPRSFSVTSDGPLSVLRGEILHWLVFKNAALLRQLITVKGHIHTPCGRSHYFPCCNLARMARPHSTGSRHHLDPATPMVRRILRISRRLKGAVLAKRTSLGCDAGLNPFN